MKAIILFDGTCNFCNAYVNFVIDHDPFDHFRFASLQSPVGQALVQPLQEQIGHLPDSIILLENGQYLLRSDAVIHIVRRLQVPGSRLIALILRFVPASVRDYSYNQFAKRRHHLLGISTSCRLPTNALRRRFLTAPPQP